MTNLPLYLRLALAVLLGAFSTPPLVTLVKWPLLQSDYAYGAAAVAAALLALWLLCWVLAIATPTATPSTGTPATRRGWALVIAPMALLIGAVLWVALRAVGLEEMLLYSRAYAPTTLVGNATEAVIGAVALTAAVLVDWSLSRRVAT
ncbi:hypothetical protein [Crossiella equi]|nr:hypothetical protein [Crossiella equi]